ncbi:MAG: hypothetical protein R3E60_00485 [Alphaproteobacteria bacterium]
MTMDGDGQDVPSGDPNYWLRGMLQLTSMLRLVSAVRQNSNDGKAGVFTPKIANRFRTVSLKGWRTR